MKLNMHTAGGAAPIEPDNATGYASDGRGVLPGIVRNINGAEVAGPSLVAVAAQSFDAHLLHELALAGVRFDCACTGLNHSGRYEVGDPLELLLAEWDWRTEVFGEGAAVLAWGAIAADAAKVLIGARVPTSDPRAWCTRSGRALAALIGGEELPER